MEGVARLDLSPSQWFHIFCLHFSGLNHQVSVSVLRPPRATCSTSPCQYWLSQSGGQEDLFQLGFKNKKTKTNKISILFIVIPEVHNWTTSPAVEVSSLGSVRPLFLCLSGIMITGFLDIKVSRTELENGALLWGDCIQLLWYWWFLDVFFLSKLFFLLHFFCLSKHLFWLPASFVERWCVVLAFVTQNWKVGWARYASSFWEEVLFFKEPWGGFLSCY